MLGDVLRAFGGEVFAAGGLGWCGGAGGACAARCGRGGKVLDVGGAADLSGADGALIVEGDEGADGDVGFRDHAGVGQLFLLAVQIPVPSSHVAQIIAQ